MPSKGPFCVYDPHFRPSFREVVFHVSQGRFHASTKTRSTFLSVASSITNEALNRRETPTDQGA